MMIRSGETLVEDFQLEVNFIIGSTCVEHFCNCSIAGFAEGF